MKVIFPDTKLIQEPFEATKAYSCILNHKIRQVKGSEISAQESWAKCETLPFEVMRMRMTTGKFLLQGEKVFLTPNLEGKKKIDMSLKKQNTGHFCIINTAQNSLLKDF